MTSVVVGLGVDLVEIARIARAMRRPAFLERVLTPAEREHCTTPTRVAGRWAAKEAVAKAVGIHLKWQEVEILPDELGVPVATIHGGQFDPSRYRLLVTISHERTHAVAVAILERRLVQIG